MSTSMTSAAEATPEPPVPDNTVLVVSQDTQYTAVSSMQYGVVARCVVYCIDVFGVGGIDDFGVRALLCVCYSLGVY